MTTIARRITGGVDTHLDVHVAAALDERGAQLGVESFPTTPRATVALLDWLEGFGTVELVGVEGTGSYGAGLTRHLLHHQGSRWSKWTGPTARRAGAREVRPRLTPWPRPGPPKVEMPTDRPRPGTGNVEAMRVLRVARSSAQAQPDPGHQPDAQPHLDRPRGAARRAARPLHLQGPSTGQRLPPHRQGPT